MRTPAEFEKSAGKPILTRFSAGEARGARMRRVNTLFADTWFSLDAYDRDQLTVTGTTKRKVQLTAEKLSAVLVKLKKVLISKKEATGIFGVQRVKNNVEGIVGNVMQSFDGQELYPTVEAISSAPILFHYQKSSCCGW